MGGLSSLWCRAGIIARDPESNFQFVFLEILAVSLLLSKKKNIKFSLAKDNDFGLSLVWIEYTLKGLLTNTKLKLHTYTLYSKPRQLLDNISKTFY